jgi:ubiquinone biosynthesis protein
MLDGLFTITRDFDMPTQPHLLLLQKTMVMEEGVATWLDPDINMWEPRSRSCANGSGASSAPKRRSRTGSCATCALLPTFRNSFAGSKRVTRRRAPPLLAAASRHRPVEPRHYGRYLLISAISGIAGAALALLFG